MSSPEFLLTFPCYLLANRHRTQIATRLVGGKQAAIVFSDLALAEDYIASTKHLEPEFVPVEFSESAFYWQLQELAEAHDRIIVDFNHKTRVGRVFEIAEIRARR